MLVDVLAGKLGNTAGKKEGEKVAVGLVNEFLLLKTPVGFVVSEMGLGNYFTFIVFVQFSFLTFNCDFKNRNQECCFHAFSLYLQADGQVFLATWKEDHPHFASD